MFKMSLVLAVLVLGAAHVAHAGGQAGSIGIGAEYQLSGIGGVSVNYDAGAFHVGGAVGFADPNGPNNSVFDLSGRFYYHVHHTAFADFGLGGSIGLSSDDTGQTGHQTLVSVEPGFEIRAFLSSNVALSANGGIVLGVADASGVAIAGSTTGLAGGFGVHYYFY